MKPIKALVPEYYNEFHCTGSECSVTCCTSAWGIFIDKNTYELYRSIKDPAVREMIVSGIKRIKGTEKSDYTYATVKPSENGLCRLLDESGLCKVQRYIGEKALCKTCRIFPRQQLLKRTGELFETSLTMACPEVVRLALFNESGIKFTETEINNDSIVLKMPTRLLQDRYTGWRDLYFDIRDICLAILRHRSLSVADRLMAVIMYLNKLENEKDAVSATAVTESVLTNLAGGCFKGLLDSFANNEAIAASVEEAVYTNIIIRRDKYNEASYRLTKLYDNFLFFVDEMDRENRIENSSKKFAVREFLREKSEPYWDDFLDNHSYILENYFVLLTFNNLIGLRPTDLSAFETAFTFAEQYAKMKLLLCTNAEEYGGITPELITDAAVLMSRDFEHGQERRKVIDFYKERGLMSLAHCSFLLR